MGIVKKAAKPHTPGVWSLPECAASADRIRDERLNAAEGADYNAVGSWVTAADGFYAGLKKPAHPENVLASKNYVESFIR